MTTEYPKDADPAQKLFFETMMANAKSTSTKIRAVVAETVTPKLDAIESNTNWLSKWLANIFKSGAGEAEQRYPSRRK